MGIYRTTIKGSQSGQTIDTVMGWLTTAASSVADATTIATRVGNFWGSYVMANSVDDYAITGVECISMDVPTIGVFVGNASSGSVGTAPAPLFCVANVEISTGLRGRSYTGRFGIPGLSVVQIDPLNGNQLDTGYQGAYQTAVGNFLTATGTGAPNPVLAVVSTISGGTPRVAPIATPATVVTVKLPLGSRVSRKS